MRLIDADELREIFLYETCVFTPNDVLDYIDSTCTIDAVPVVRCRDCKWDRPDKLLNKHWCTRIFGCTEVREDDFCSCGRRKEDAP